MSKKGIRICAVLLVLLMCLSLLPMAAWADGATLKEIVNEVPATCTTDGMKKYWLDTNGDVYLSDPTETGEIGAEITDRSGYTGTMPVIPAGHKLVEHDAVASTCKDQGTAAYWECSECHKLFSDAAGTTEITAPAALELAAHTFQDGKCTVCGEADPDYTAALTGEVVILGSPYPGETLTADLENSNATGSIFYEWGYSGGGSIEGATSESYTVKETDVGKALICVVTTSDQNGKLTSGSVTIEKTPAKTYSLSVNYNAGGKVSYSVDGAESSTFPAGKGLAVDEGSKVNLTITPDGGYAVKDVLVNNVSQGAITSYAISSMSQDTRVVVTFEKQAAPSYTVSVGAPSLVKNGVYSYDVTVKDASGNAVSDTGSTKVEFVLSYPSGMTSASHTYDVKHNGTESVSFNALADGVHVYGTKFSPYVLTATPAPLTGTVKISGSTTVGSTLTAKVTDTNNTGNLSYQWKRAGTAITGETGSTYVTRSADVGKAITCDVTSNVQTGTRSSNALTITTEAVNKVKVVAYPSNRGTVSVGQVLDSNGKASTYKPTKDTNGNYLVPDGYSVQFVITPSKNYRTSRVITDGNKVVKDVKDGEIPSFVVWSSTSDATYTAVMQYIGSSPRTGDNANMPLWTELGAASLVILAAALIVMKKKKVF